MYSMLFLLLVANLVTANDGSPPSSVTDILKTCWRKSFDFRCLEKSVAMNLRSIRDQDHYQLMDIITLDKTSNKESSSRAMKGDGIGQILGELIETRSLGIMLPGGEYAIRAHRAADDPEQMELTIEPRSLEQARQNRIAKIMIPLVLGFKVTGVIVVVLTLVKLFLLKALVVSKVALMATLHLLAKKMISSIMTSSHPYIYDGHGLGSLDHHEGSYSNHDYAYTPYHMGHAGEMAQGSSPLGFAALYPSVHHPSSIRVTETTTSDDDLQGQFSNDDASFAKATTKNDTQPIHVTRKNFAAAGVDSYADYSNYYGNAVDNGYGYGYGYGAAAHRTPVMAYRKAITTGRSTDASETNAIA